MERIIKGLVSIENEAALISKEAELEKRNLPGNIQEQAKAIKERVERETGQTVKAMYDAAQGECDEKIADINGRSLRQREALSQVCEQRREQWEAEIFDRILGW